MPVYEYRCPLCGSEGQQLRNMHDNGPLPLCPTCGTQMCRKYSTFAIKPSMPAHFNQSVGSFVTNERNFADELKRASEAASAPRQVFDADGESIIITPPEHNFVPVDPHDKERLGVTDDGMEETYRRLRNEGRMPGQVWL